MRNTEVTKTESSLISKYFEQVEIILKIVTQMINMGQWGGRIDQLYLVMDTQFLPFAHNFYFQIQLHRLALPNSQIKIILFYLVWELLLPISSYSV